jgi:hypothetical protein
MEFEEDKKIKIEDNFCTYSENGTDQVEGKKLVMPAEYLNSKKETISLWKKIEKDLKN